MNFKQVEARLWIRRINQQTCRLKNQRIDPYYILEPILQRKCGHFQAPNISTKPPSSPDHTIDGETIQTFVWFGNYKKVPQMYCSLHLLTWIFQFSSTKHQRTPDFGPFLSSQPFGNQRKTLAKGTLRPTWRIIPLSNWFGTGIIGYLGYLL